MLSSDMLLEGDLYFDSPECFDSQEGLVFDNNNSSEFEFWLSEPLSVNERRQRFLSQMGLADQIIGLERISECCDGVVSNSSAFSSYGEEGNSVFCDREMNSEANSMIDDLEVGHQLEKRILDCENMYSESVQPELECDDAEECKFFSERTQKMKSWWKFFLRKSKKHHASEVSKLNLGATKSNRMKVKQNKKRCKEFTGVYMGQELKAHKGFIWCMKFSPDGQYLATGGEDGVVRIWHVTSADASHESFALEGNLSSNWKEQHKLSFSRKKIRRASVIIPEKIFRIEESPIYEFHGHASDILDIAWSNSNCLLSSSKDETVRLWQVGYNHCINVFHHTNYVTCVQFNPIDENYFISGSIDGKVRIWGVSEKRVVDWVDARDVTSTICYEPDGKGFVVGSVTGTCRFYKASGNDLELEAEIYVGKKRSSGGITGIQFSHDRPQRVMITSEDSKLRIFDGFDVVHKFKGLPNSGSQMSASFTSTGRHIVSVGEDSRVYVWDYDGMCIPSSKHAKSVRSCEHFFYEGVSAAVPWSGMRTETRGVHSCTLHSRMQTEDSASASRSSRLGNCFFMDGSCGGSSATWPEEILRRWDDDEAITERGSHDHEQQHYKLLEQQASLSDAWGLVIVTAGFDGSIRTFHNYGLPLAEY